jgi:hypothetical protein
MTAKSNVVTSILLPSNGSRPITPAYEYCSPWTLFGWPLIHIRFGGEAGKQLPVKGWIACGHVAYGILFASGGVAVGYMACGGAAIAWLAACGGAAVAHNFALGGIALAQHGNDKPALFISPRARQPAFQFPLT